MDEAPALQVPLSLTNPDQAATIPAALAVLGEDTSPESPHQHGIEQLAAAFLEKVEAPASAIPDAGYAARWTAAQLESDARMKAGYGQHVWLRHHADVYRQAFAPPADPAP